MTPLQVATEKKRVQFESEVKETHYEYDISVTRKKKFSLFKRKGGKKGKVSQPRSLGDGGDYSYLHTSVGCLHVLLLLLFRGPHSSDQVLRG